MVCRRVCSPWRTAAEKVLEKTDKLWITDHCSSTMCTAYCRDEHHIITDKYRVATKQRTLSDVEVNAISRLCPSVKIIVFRDWNNCLTTNVVNKILQTSKDSIRCWCSDDRFFKLLNQYSLPSLEHFVGYSISGKGSITADERKSDTVTFLSLQHLHPRLNSFTYSFGFQLDWSILPQGIEYLKAIHNLSRLAESTAASTLKTIRVVNSDDLMKLTTSARFPSVTEICLDGIVGRRFGIHGIGFELKRKLIDALFTVFPSLSRLIYNGDIGTEVNEKGDPSEDSFPLTILFKLQHVELTLSRIEPILLTERLRLPQSVTLNIDSGREPGNPLQIISRIATGIQELHLMIWPRKEPIPLNELVTFVDTHMVNGSMKILKFSTHDINHFNQDDMRTLQTLQRRLKNIKITHEGKRISLMTDSTEWNKLFFEAKTSI